MSESSAPKKNSYTPEEQIKYANLLFWGAWVSIGILVITFLIYVSGLFSPYIPLQEITKCWCVPVDEYIHNTGIPVGWGWVTLLDKSDYFNFIGIVILASMTGICFVCTLLPAYIKKKDWVYTIIVILQLVVLAVATSGVLGSGGH
jgi:uncharacterized membrane protein